MNGQLKIIGDSIPVNRVFSSLFVIILFLISFTGLSQESESSKARRFFDNARYAFDSGDFQSAESNLGKAIKADPAFADAYILLGDVFLETGRAEEAVKQYRKSLECNPGNPAIIYNLLGNTLFALENYTEACPYYQQLLAIEDIRADLRSAIETKLALCNIRKNLMDKPVAFHPVNLGTGVNSPDDEYVNTISADESTLYFTRREKTHDPDGKEYIENFFFSVKSGNEWLEARRLGYPEGIDDDAGALCISPDGSIIFFTSCFRRDGFGSCDLYYSERNGDIWTAPRNMGNHINSDLWDAQPSLSSDGSTLYFASNRRGGYGSADIWAIKRTPEGAWSKPYNLGPEINTVEADMAPFIHFDNKTLYFSSKGHPGLGGADLFKSALSHNKWEDPVNFGYPVNSSADELVIIINSAGDRGFISNNSLEGEGNYDIFSFELNDDVKPTPVTFMKGIVFDKENHAPLSAWFELLDLSEDTVIIRAASNPETGEFLVCLPLGRDYALNVSSRGYLFYSEHFPLKEIKSKSDPLVKDIPMSKIAAGNIITLNNIFYETDQYRLKEASFPELDKLVTFLEQNPGISAEISGHTDSEGTAEYNIMLSENRAGTVYQYLVGKGIDAKRLTFKGYGKNMPVASNDSEEGKAMNRRTEIKILKSE